MTPSTAWVQVGKGCYGRNRLTPIITYRSPFFLLSGEIVCIMYPLSFSSSTYDIRIWTLILSFSANFRPYTYWPLVLASCAISQHLSAIFIFLVTFSHLYDESWDPRILVWVSICMFLTGFAIWELFECFMFGYNVDKEHSEWTNHVLSFLRLTKCVWTF